MQCENTTGGFGVEASAQRVEKLIEGGGDAHAFALSRLTGAGVMNPEYANPDLIGACSTRLALCPSPISFSLPVEPAIWINTRPLQRFAR
jgi:hypothetical protein